jgi:hypothetical protein
LDGLHGPAHDGRTVYGHDQIERRIGIKHHIDNIADAHRTRELLSDFSHQRVPRILARLDLTAGEFPTQSKRLVGSTL